MLCEQVLVMIYLPKPKETEAPRVVSFENDTFFESTTRDESSHCLISANKQWNSDWCFWLLRSCGFFNGSNHIIAYNRNCFPIRSYNNATNTSFVSYCE